MTPRMPQKIVSRTKLKSGIDLLPVQDFTEDADVGLALYDGPEIAWIVTKLPWPMRHSEHSSVQNFFKPESWKSLVARTIGSAHIDIANSEDSSDLDFDGLDCGAQSFWPRDSHHFLIDPKHGYSSSPQIRQYPLPIEPRSELSS